MTDSTVSLRGVRRQFVSDGMTTTALGGVGLDVPTGQWVAIMGATGSGKSTLLRCAAGLERPDAGQIRLLGHDITRLAGTARGQARLALLRRDRIGFVFQSYNLLTELSVEANVALPFRLGASSPRNGPTPDQVLGVVGLAGMGRRRVAGLSGGQQQRVALARALVTRPEVIFADEPTGALDPATGASVLSLLRAEVDARAVTVVMVTHDPAAAALADRLILLRDGQIVADEPARSAEYIGAQLAAVSVVATGPSALVSTP
jgi:putative ABC transport system ATP-binding protein